MKSRVKENKELLEAYLVYVGQLEPGVSVEKFNSSNFSIIAGALIDISQSLAVIADSMSKEETESTTAVLKIPEPRSSRNL